MLMDTQTILPVKLIDAGWGSSGYYSEALLKNSEAAFPPGTQMFLNHPVEGDRPEGNHEKLAAVLVKSARYDANGREGAGLYSEALIFSDHKTAIMEKAPYTGLSIRTGGTAVMGEAHGRRGKIITSLAPGGRVDFVTKAGRGGKIVLSEAYTLPDEEEITIDEAEGVEHAEVQIEESARPVETEEAHNAAEHLEAKLHQVLTNLADDKYASGSVNRDERKILSKALGQALDAYRETVKELAPQLFHRSSWASAPDSSDMPKQKETAEEAGKINTEESNMTVTIEGLQEALAAANARSEALQREVNDMKGKLDAERAISESLREQAVMRDARDFAQAIIAEAELPDMTRNRLLRQATANPPTHQGTLDERAFRETVEESVREAVQEINQIRGRFGVWGVTEEAATTAKPAAKTNGRNGDEVFANLHKAINY